MKIKIDCRDLNCWSRYDIGVYDTLTKELSCSDSCEDAPLGCCYFCLASINCKESAEDKLKFLCKFIKYIKNKK